ncbi:MAG: hypothetical protein GEU75_14475 [Dehalococcoidia bacterium]|nr:hypothetical protein [Dehalococcoidia bacterium]
MIEKVRISFEPSFQDDPSPHVVVLNPGVLPFALRSQVARFGLVETADGKSTLSGNLKGNRGGFTQMIESYGVEIEVVRSDRQIAASA